MSSRRRSDPNIRKEGRENRHPFTPASITEGPPCAATFPYLTNCEVQLKSEERLPVSVERHLAPCRLLTSLIRGRSTIWSLPNKKSRCVPKRSLERRVNWRGRRALLPWVLRVRCSLLAFLLQRFLNLLLAVFAGRHGSYHHQHEAGKAKEELPLSRGPMRNR